MPNRTIISALLLILPGAFSSHADAKETTVALTATVYDGADKHQNDLMGGLLDLLQATLSVEPDLSVVERRQINLVMHELALSSPLNQNPESRLQLGKIATADVMLTLELKAPEEADAAPQIVVRIVESLTGIIRGVSVASLEDDRIDKAATQIADYFKIIQADPTHTPVTVAVAPFECQGRFDRLRPLELGLRDMVTNRLTLWSDTLAKELVATERLPAEKDEDLRPANSFHVLQRSGMKELLAELELIQSAMADRSRLPKTLPSRAAAFLVRGTVNETSTDGEFRIVVAAELIDASSNNVVKDFQFSTTPKELEVNVAHGVDLFAGHLTRSIDANQVGVDRLRELHETQSSYEAVLADLRRFRRRNPIFYGYTDLALNGRSSGPPVVIADSTLGQSLLKKCIDRLEVALFVNPDNMPAAYALGYCFSFHIKGIEQPKRADELLRKVGTAAEESSLRAAALKLLAEISFHHSTGQPDKTMLATAAEQVAFAFIKTPEGKRDEMWARMIELFEGTLSKTDDQKMLSDLAEFCGVQAANPKSPYRGQMATFQIEVAERLRVVRSDPSSSESMELQKLLGSEDPSVRNIAAHKLAAIALMKRNYLEAAEIYTTTADSLVAVGDKLNVSKAENLRYHAARSMRLGGDFKRARTLLESFSPVYPTSLNAGYRAVELAQCYMHDGENERALTLLVDAAENVWSLTFNSNVEQLIAELGGVPLREDREIDVAYITGPNKEMISGNFIADGDTLILAGQKNGNQNGIRFYDTTAGHLTFEATDFGRVLSLKRHKNRLWAVTDSGLWYREMESTTWNSITTENGLPDNRVATIAFAGDVVYAGIGTRGAGGLVRIDPDGTVTVQTGDNAPASVVYSLAVFEDRLVAATQPVVHELNLKTGVWTKRPGYIQVYEGKQGIWSSKPGRELEPYGADSESAEQFKPTWFTGYGKSGYGVSFVIEKDNQIWLGGGPWQSFVSSGFYRFDPRNQKFVMYGPRDGFRGDGSYRVSSGAAIGDHFWLMTSEGLARVTPRMPGETQMPR